MREQMRAHHAGMRQVARHAKHRNLRGDVDQPMIARDRRDEPHGGEMFRFYGWSFLAQPQCCRRDKSVRPGQHQIGAAPAVEGQQFPLAEHSLLSLQRPHCAHQVIDAVALRICQALPQLRGENLAVVRIVTVVGSVEDRGLNLVDCHVLV